MGSYLSSLLACILLDFPESGTFQSILIKKLKNTFKIK